MKRLIIITLMFASTFLGAQVYPGAVGFGSQWTFPTNYEVRIVTDLGDNGSGTLREAIETPTATDAVIVVYNGLSGTTLLDTQLNLGLSKKLYIEFGTSTNGIMLRMKSDVNDPIWTRGGTIDGLIIRNAISALGETTSRPETIPHGGEGQPGSGDSDGGNVSGDNVTFVGNAQNIIFDKCLFKWSTDEQLNLFSTTDITIQRSIICEALMYASHRYTTDSSDGAYYRPHSMGMIIGQTTTDITLYKILWAHNNQRNPLFGNTGGDQRTEMVNNYVYNWGDSGSLFNEDDGILSINAINNVYDMGPNSRTNRRPMGVSPNNEGANGDDIHLYVRSLYADNYGNDWDLVAYADNALLGAKYNNPLPEKVKKYTPHNFPLANVPSMSRSEIKQKALEEAGTIFNSPTEVRIKNHVDIGTGSLIDDPVDVGGYEVIASATIIPDSDQDGIPNSEEATWGDDTWGYLLSRMDSVPPIDPGPNPVPGSDILNRRNAIFGIIN